MDLEGHGSSRKGSGPEGRGTWGERGGGRRPARNARGVAQRVVQKQARILQDGWLRGVKQPWNQGWGGSWGAKCAENRSTRRPGEGRGPGYGSTGSPVAVASVAWIPAFAGMTSRWGLRATGTKGIAAKAAPTPQRLP